MIRFDRGLAAATAIALAAAFAAAGCGRNAGSLPAGFAPEGQAGNNLLFTQVLPFGPDSASATPGVVVTIYDRTAATAYRVYRSVDSGPFDLAGLYPAQPTGTFNGGGELFEFTDLTAPVGRPINYLARGIVDGEETRSSAVTNVATVPTAANPTDLYPGAFLLVDPTSTPDTLAVVDSLPLFVWQPVTGATRYALQIIRNDGRLFFLGLTPDATPFYQYGTNAGLIVQSRPLSLSTFVWSAAALDASSRVIASTEFDVFQVDTIGFTARVPNGDERSALEAARLSSLFGPSRRR